MFKKKIDEITPLKEKIMLLEKRVSLLDDKIDPLNSDIAKIENNVERRLLQFHKEITDKYFETLEKILKVHTETSLITALANQITPKTLDNLKSSLLQPFLETKWEEQEHQKGLQISEKLKIMGEKLIQMRKELHDEYIIKNREEKDTKEIEGKISVLDLIMGDKL